jgi:hypothetical protein
MPTFKHKPSEHFQEETETAGETPRDKFVRLGVSRMNRALNTIRLIGNLASPAYEWTEQDVEDIRTSINAVVEETMRKFDKHHRGEKVEFQFASESEPEAGEAGPSQNGRVKTRE